MAFGSIESACREEEEKREEGMKVVMMEPVLLLVILEETEDFREGSAGQRERERRNRSYTCFGSQSVPCVFSQVPEEKKKERENVNCMFM